MAEKYKTKECKVLSYDEVTKEIHFEFDGYGITDYSDNVKIKDGMITVKYIGKIDKGFKYKL